MAESIRRKSSSRQLLQNLIRVTAQRSQEDAEEVERERRRRAREKQRGERSPSWPEPPHRNGFGLKTELDEELKPNCCLALEEDEGFSDWSHRLENRSEQEVHNDCREQRPSASKSKSEPKEVKQLDEEDEEGCDPEQSQKWPPEKMSNNRKEVKTSYSSTVFLPQDTRLPDRTSYLVAGTMRTRGGAFRIDREVEQEDHKVEEEVRADLHSEWRSAETQQNPVDDDDQEEELSFTHENKEDVRMEERHREEVEAVEEYKIPDRNSVEGWRRQEMSALSLRSSSENEESFNCYGPMSPTFKKLLIQFYPDEVNSRVSTDGKCMITEDTKSPRKSTNSTKKTLPLVPVSKIYKKVEQYTHALEVSSKDGRTGNQVLMDLTSACEPVSSKRDFFEAREAWNKNAVSITQSKDADGFKVGVADLINQWVKGSEDGSRCSSPSKPSESSTSKRYKFVVMGHGKYEKVSVDNNCSQNSNCQSVGQFYEDL